MQMVASEYMNRILFFDLLLQKSISVELWFTEKLDLIKNEQLKYDYGFS